MEKHFVTFNSPGTMFAEQSTRPINTWNVEVAIDIAKEIKERHGARPYGFYFTTRTRGDDDFDSKESNKSNFYYLGGKIETLDEIKAKDNPEDKRLIRNMERNKWDRVISTTEGWKCTQPLEKGDIVLQV